MSPTSTMTCTNTGGRTSISRQEPKTSNTPATMTMAIGRAEKKTARLATTSKTRDRITARTSMVEISVGLCGSVREGRLKCHVLDPNAHEPDRKLKYTQSDGRWPAPASPVPEGG